MKKADDTSSLTHFSLRKLREEFRTLGSQVRWSTGLSAAVYESDAFKMPLQWHLWSDGEQTASAVRTGNAWGPGPDLDVADFNEGTRIADELTQLGERANGVGVIFHFADEAAFSAIKKGMESPGHYTAADLTIIDDPGSVVEEKPSAACAYRFVPLPGSKSATAVKIPQSRVQLVDHLIVPGSKFRFAFQSAALELVSLAPYYVPFEEPQNALVVVLFRRFSVVAGFRAEGLALLTQIPHAGREFPAALGPRLASEIRATNKEASDVWLVQATATAALEEVIADLQAYAEEDKRFADMTHLAALPYGDLSNELQAAAGSKSPEGPPSAFLRPEFLHGTLHRSLLKPHADATPRSSGLIARAAWRNGLNAALEVERTRITRGEAGLLLASRLAITIVAAGLLGFAGWFGWQAWGIAQEAYWRLPEAEARKVAAKRADLESVERASAFLTAAVQPRSSLWVSMELMNHLFPEQSGLILRKAAYELLFSDNLKPGAAEKSASMHYEWRFDGLANEHGIRLLETTGKEQVASLLEQFSNTDSSAYVRPGKGREVELLIDRRTIRPVELSGRTFVSSFTMSLSIRVPPTDPVYPQTKVPPMPSRDLLETYAVKLAGGS